MLPTSTHISVSLRSTSKPQSKPYDCNLRLVCACLCARGCMHLESRAGAPTALVFGEWAFCLISLKAKLVYHV